MSCKGNFVGHLFYKYAKLFLDTCYFLFIKIVILQMLLQFLLNIVSIIVNTVLYVMFSVKTYCYPFKKK